MHIREVRFQGMVAFAIALNPHDELYLPRMAKDHIACIDLDENPIDLRLFRCEGDAIVVRALLGPDLANRLL
jgi:hypothetical protein